MFFHRLSKTSTCVSAESIATPYRCVRERSKCRVKNLTSDRVDISLANRAVQGEDEALSRLSESENEAKLCPEEQRNQLLSQAKAGTMKEECRADFAECSIRELIRPIQSNRMELDHTNLGYEQTRREQVRLHEEFAQRRRALRESHVRNIHELEELKRVQEMRIDECSKQELRESQTSIHIPNTRLAR